MEAEIKEEATGEDKLSLQPRDADREVLQEDQLMLAGRLHIDGISLSSVHLKRNERKVIQCLMRFRYS